MIRESAPSRYKEENKPWPVSWSAVWVGALASVAAVTIFGLVQTALGVSSLERIKDFSTWKSVTLMDMAAAVFGAFFAFVIGGWVAGKIGGFERAESSILHGAIAWLTALPIVLAFLMLGADSAFAGWYGGILGGMRLGSAAAAPPLPEVIRHDALAGVTAILLGLMGSVIGGWMACGEPMSLTHHRRRIDTIGSGRGGEKS